MVTPEKLQRVREHGAGGLDDAVPNPGASSGGVGNPVAPSPMGAAAGVYFDAQPARDLIASPQLDAAPGATASPPGAIAAGGVYGRSIDSPPASVGVPSLPSSAGEGYTPSAQETVAATAQKTGEAGTVDRSESERESGGGIAREEPTCIQEAMCTSGARSEEGFNARRQPPRPTKKAGSPDSWVSSGDVVHDSGPSKRARVDDDREEKQETSGRSTGSESDFKVRRQPPRPRKEAGSPDPWGASRGAVCDRGQGERTHVDGKSGNQQEATVTRSRRSDKELKARREPPRLTKEAGSPDLWGTSRGAVRGNASSKRVRIDDESEEQHDAGQRRKRINGSGGGAPWVGPAGAEAMAVTGAPAGMPAGATRAGARAGAEASVGFAPASSVATADVAPPVAAVAVAREAAAINFTPAASPAPMQQVSIATRMCGLNLETLSCVRAPISRHFVE